MRKHNWKSAARYGWALATVLLLAIAVTQLAQGQTFNVIHTFTGPDGADPYAGVTLDQGGNLYGTTDEGGAGQGEVFKLTRRNSSWILDPLYLFAGGNDGAGSASGVTFGPDGSLYGATLFGGGGTLCQMYQYPGCGTVFNLRPFPTVCKTALCYWNETVLYHFTGVADGSHPWGDLTFDPAGDIYGVTYQAGPYGGNTGLVYELTPTPLPPWPETVIYPFTGGNDGDSPHAGVIFDMAGNLYGTTLFGGAYGCGVVFQLTPSDSGWTEHVLYTFQCGTDGDGPYSGVIFDQAGNLYGTTYTAGAGGGGTVFELSPPGTWTTLTVLYSFTGASQCGPQGNVVMDKAGNLYGTTVCDGAGYGNIFELSPSGSGWTYTDLYDFTDGSDGAYPFGNAVFDSSSSKLYGTASEGGNLSDCNRIGCGVVWEITGLD